jgi:hypothetical protein|tara:strand:- start:359 stop:664 length:306 start_codon:yes stop_codon:yes gene_type:complete
MKDFIEFVDHIESFYGKDGIYDIGVSRLDIALALGYYCKGLNRQDFATDSIDREAVRDILLDERYFDYTWNPVQKAQRITAQDYCGLALDPSKPISIVKVS